MHVMQEKNDASHELMHIMQEQIDACDARMIFFFFFVWSLQSYSLIKSWVQNRVSTASLIQFLKV